MRLSDCEDEDLDRYKDHLVQQEPEKFNSHNNLYV